MFIKSLKNPTYENIKFKTTNLGKQDSPLIMYETTTLAPSNDGTGEPFGFRIRTDPKELKKITFWGTKNLTLMRFNTYSYGDGTFNCEGDGVIAMPNFQRLFQKMGATLIHDQNATCDPEGRYNYFHLKYGNKTEIKEIGNHCYDVVIFGNDDSCEILPATEKIMVELFNKYLELTSKK